jgi:hypothetical protein
MHYRLMFLRRLSIADRDIALVGAPKWSLLLETTHRFDTVPGAVSDCGKLDWLDCIGAPTKTAINSQIPVQVNGRMVSIAVGGTLFDALQAAGVKPSEVEDAMLAKVKVQRLWHGRPVAIASDEKDPPWTRLTMLAGDRIEW